MDAIRSQLNNPTIDEKPSLAGSHRPYTLIKATQFLIRGKEFSQRPPFRGQLSDNLS